MSEKKEVKTNQVAVEASTMKLVRIYGANNGINIKETVDAALLSYVGEDGLGSK